MLGLGFYYTSYDDSTELESTFSDFSTKLIIDLFYFIGLEIVGEKVDFVNGFSLRLS